MEELFKDILEDDEQIIEIIKPDKKRYRKAFWPFAIPFFWPMIILVSIFSGFTVYWMISKSYKNLYYAYTDKRLIFRSGTFGIHFSSLEYKDITATSVNVSYIDQKCGTGSISFASPSVHAAHAMTFNFIPKPYERMKAIKEEIAKAERRITEKKDA